MPLRPAGTVSTLYQFPRPRTTSYQIRNGRHVGHIFTRLGLLPSDDDHRRVLAVLRYLES